MLAKLQGYHGGSGNGSGIGASLGLAHSQILTLDVIIGIGNICLLLILLYMYIKSYRDFKTKFTFGLLAFASLLLLQNILFTGFIMLNQGFRGPSMGVPIFFLSITEFFALLILIYVTKE